MMLPLCEPPPCVEENIFTSVKSVFFLQCQTQIKQLVKEEEALLATEKKSNK